MGGLWSMDDLCSTDGLCSADGVCTERCNTLLPNRNGAGSSSLSFNLALSADGLCFMGGAYFTGGASRPGIATFSCTY